MDTGLMVTQRSQERNIKDDLGRKGRTKVY